MKLNIQFALLMTSLLSTQICMGLGHAKTFTTMETNGAADCACNPSCLLWRTIINNNPIAVDDRAVIASRLYSFPFDRLGEIKNVDTNRSARLNTHARRYLRFISLNEVNGSAYSPTAKISDVGVSLVQPGETAIVSTSVTKGTDNTKAGNNEEPPASASNETTPNKFASSGETLIDTKSNADPFIDTTVNDPPNHVDNPSIQILPQSGWIVHYVDSEELSGAYRPASNAIDGDPDTFWITEWSNRQTPFPHELQIDLGQTYELYGIYYLPRQNLNQGRIIDYEIYVSIDGNDWGSPVAQGRFVDGAARQEVPFNAATGRYVRLRALSETQGRFYSSIAEINLLGVLSDVQQIISPELNEPYDSTPKTSVGVISANADDPIDWASVLTGSTGRHYFVTTEDEFNAKSSLAQPGDVVIVKNGTYTGWNLSIRSNGNASKPVVYTAQTAGGVTFTRSTKVLVTGDFNTIGGFTFKGLTRHNAVLFERANDNRFTNNTFSDCGEEPKSRILGIRDNSNRNRFDHNLMQRSRSIGMAVELPKDDDYSFEYSYDNRFDHNVFSDVAKQTSTQYAMSLQVGQYATRHSRDETRTIVDHNSFINLGAEAINSKSNDESYLYNRFEGISRNALVLRSGDNKRVEGNFFENVWAAIQAYGTGHVIVNNVVTSATDIGILIPKWGLYQISSTGYMSASSPTGDMIVAFNTFLNAANKTVELGRTWGFLGREGWIVADNPPFNVKFVNNIFSSDSGTLFHNRGAIDELILSNIFHATGSARVGDAGVEAIISDPGLKKTFRLTAGSIAIDRASQYQSVDKDFYNRTRDRYNDIGAYEVPH